MTRQIKVQDPRQIQLCVSFDTFPQQVLFPHKMYRSIILTLSQSIRLLSSPILRAFVIARTGHRYSIYARYTVRHSHCSSTLVLNFACVEQKVHTQCYIALILLLPFLIHTFIVGAIYSNCNMSA